MVNITCEIESTSSTLPVSTVIQSSHHPHAVSGNLSNLVASGLSTTSESVFITASCMSASSPTPGPASTKHQQQQQQQQQANLQQQNKQSKQQQHLPPVAEAGKKVGAKKPADNINGEPNSLNQGNAKNALNAKPTVQINNLKETGSASLRTEPVVNRNNRAAPSMAPLQGIDGSLQKAAAHQHQYSQLARERPLSGNLMQNSFRGQGLPVKGQVRQPPQGQVEHNGEARTPTPEERDKRKQLQESPPSD
ncbi:mastermind-like protein 3 [Dreissena polymorpha]|uniref:mastermind-like protein 3 n=1 Tax=Dreissena polymorpha TaxID=45954 RepID=UPI0022641039|nr:mastermind-like protein 3 [Dreissena polymorpha]